MEIEYHSLSLGSDELSQECDVCYSQSLNFPAVSYCTVCSEYLCLRCEQSHRGSKASKNHPLVREGKVPSAVVKTLRTSPIMYCDVHKSTPVNLFCKTHDAVICTMCKIVSHKKCAVAELNSKTIMQGGSDAPKTVIAKMGDLKKSLEALKLSKVSDKAVLEEKHVKCIQDMYSIRHRLNDLLKEQLEPKALAGLERDEEPFEQSIDEHIAITNDILRQIADQEKIMEECLETEDDGVIFIGMKKVASRLSEYKNIVDNLQNDTKVIDIQFKPNPVIIDMMETIVSLGTIVIQKMDTKGENSVLTMSVTDRKAVDVESQQVFQCTFMPDGHLVIGCEGLKVFDENLHFKSHLPILSDNISSPVNSTDVITVQSHTRQLIHVRVLPYMEEKRRYQLSMTCEGVDVFEGEMYVTCHDGQGHGEVQVLNMDGQLLRRLGMEDGERIFAGPNYIAVSKNGSKIFVSDCTTNQVTCLSKYGSIVYQYSDQGVIPFGMYVDSEDNLLVCGKNSHSVIIVRDDGQKEKVLLSKKDGVHFPMSVSFRKKDGCLVVGLGSEAKTDRKLLIYRIG